MTLTPLTSVSHTQAQTIYGYYVSVHCHCLFFSFRFDCQQSIIIANDFSSYRLDSIASCFTFLVAFFCSAPFRNWNTQNPFVQLCFQSEVFRKWWQHLTTTITAFIRMECWYFLCSIFVWGQRCNPHDHCFVRFTYITIKSLKSFWAQIVLNLSIL